MYSGRNRDQVVFLKIGHFVGYSLLSNWKGTVIGQPQWICLGSTLHLYAYQKLAQISKMSDVQPLFKLCVSASNMRYVDFIMMMVNEKFPK